MKRSLFSTCSLSCSSTASSPTRTSETTLVRYAPLPSPTYVSTTDNRAFFPTRMIFRGWMASGVLRRDGNERKFHRHVQRQAVRHIDECTVGQEGRLQRGKGVPFTARAIRASGITGGSSSAERRPPGSHPDARGELSTVLERPASKCPFTKTSRDVVPRENVRMDHRIR